MIFSIRRAGMLALMGLLAQPSLVLEAGNLPSRAVKVLVGLKCLDAISSLTGGSGSTVLVAAAPVVQPAAKGGTEPPLKELAAKYPRYKCPSRGFPDPDGIPSHCKPGTPALAREGEDAANLARSLGYLPTFAEYELEADMLVLDLDDCLCRAIHDSAAERDPDGELLDRLKAAEAQVAGLREAIQERYNVRKALYDEMAKNPELYKAPTWEEWIAWGLTDPDIADDVVPHPIRIEMLESSIAKMDALRKVFSGPVKALRKDLDKKVAAARRKAAEKEEGRRAASPAKGVKQEKAKQS